MVVQFDIFFLEIYHSRLFTNISNLFSRLEMIFLFIILCSLLYGAEDPSIAGMVLDSAFADLFDLMMELVDVYKIRLPKFTV